MVKAFSVFIYYLFFLLILVAGGIGAPFTKETSHQLILIMPFFLYGIQGIETKRLLLPKIPSSLFILFLGFSLVSLFITHSFFTSFQVWVSLLSIYLIFLYTFNNKEKLEKYFIPFLFLVSFILSIYSLLLNYIFPSQMQSLIPPHGYQFVFSRFGAHNHLGDFLVIPLVISSYYLLKNNHSLFTLVTTVFFSLLLIFSYSRTAYIALLITLVIMSIYMFFESKMLFTIKKGIVIGTVSFLLLILFFATAVEFGKRAPFSSLNSFLGTYAHLEQKTFVARRPYIFSDALSSIKEKPLFGVGMDNFKYISEKYTIFPHYRTHSSHNILLDVFSENGLLAGGVFVIFIAFLLFRSTVSSPLFFVTVGMFLQFQTDYVHRIESYLLLFLVIIAFIYKDSKNHSDKKSESNLIYFILLLISSVIFLGSQFVLWRN